jgi:hypothetical protein
MENPFIFEKIAQFDNFCNGQKEIILLADIFDSLVNL